MKSIRLQQLEASLEFLRSGDQWLPQPWQVIYSEAVRGNHLLFMDADGHLMVDINQIDISEKPSESPGGPILAALVLTFLRRPDLSLMRKAIAGLPSSHRQLAFSLYLRAVDRLAAKRRSSLN